MLGVDGSTAITPLRFLALLLVVSGVVPATACIGSNAISQGSRARHHATATSASPTACSTPRVQYRPYPGHGQGLSQIPWVRGEPADSRVGRPSLVLAAIMDEAASARGADLHRRRRSGWVQREDPVDVPCAIGEVAGRTKPRGSGPPTGWLSDFPATAILPDQLYGPARGGVVCLHHQRSAYRLLATGSEESRAQRAHPVSSRARPRLGRLHAQPSLDGP